MDTAWVGLVLPSSTFVALGLGGEACGSERPRNATLRHNPRRTFLFFRTWAAARFTSFHRGIFVIWREVLTKLEKE